MLVSVSNPFGDIMDHAKYRTLVYFNGSVVYTTAGKLVTSCDLDMHFAPFDSQTCYINVDSWTYPDNMVKLSNRSSTVDTSQYQPNGQGELIDTEVIVQHESFDVGTFTNLFFVFYLQRKPLFYCSVLVFPVAMLSVVRILPIILPADSSEKISLEITVILSLIVFQLVKTEKVPETSDYVRLMCRYTKHTLMAVNIHTHTHTNTQTYHITHTHTHTYTRTNKHTHKHAHTHAHAHAH